MVSDKLVMVCACEPDRSSERKAKVTPWDAGDLQPPLRDLLNSGELKLPTAGRALVPGCGRVSTMYCL